MALINKNGGPLVKGEPRIIYLNKTELKAIPKLTESNFYSQEEVWSLITLDYRSDELKQVAQARFENLTVENPESTISVKPLFQGNLEIKNIIIYDQAGGSFTITRKEMSELVRSELDFEVNDPQ